MERKGSEQDQQGRLLRVCTKSIVVINGVLHPMAYLNGFMRSCVPGVYVYECSLNPSRLLLFLLLRPIWLFLFTVEDVSLDRLPSFRVRARSANTVSLSNPYSKHTGGDNTD